MELRGIYIEFPIRTAQVIVKMLYLFWNLDFFYVRVYFRITGFQWRVRVPCHGRRVDLNNLIRPKTALLFRLLSWRVSTDTTHRYAPFYGRRVRPRERAEKKTDHPEFLMQIHDSWHGPKLGTRAREVLTLVPLIENYIFFSTRNSCRDTPEKTKYSSSRFFINNKEIFLFLFFPFSALELFMKSIKWICGGEKKNYIKKGGKISVARQKIRDLKI